MAALVPMPLASNVLKGLKPDPEVPVVSKVVRLWFMPIKQKTRYYSSNVLYPPDFGAFVMEDRICTVPLARRTRRRIWLQGCNVLAQLYRQPIKADPSEAYVMACQNQGVLKAKAADI